MRSALRALASRSQSKEPKNGQASKMPANGRVPIEDGEQRISGAEVLEAPRAGLGKTHRRTWASVPARLTTIRRVFSEAAGEELDDHRAGEVLYEASREAHQAAIDLERLAAALKRRAA
jgi:hypothetical protein